MDICFHGPQAHLETMGKVESQQPWVNVLNQKYEVRAGSMQFLTDLAFK